MATIQEAVRRLTVESVSKGLPQTTEQLKQLGQAHSGVAVESQKTERATQSMERRLQSIQRQYDRNFRVTQQMARVERDLNAAVAQGLITTARKNELMTMAAARHTANAAAVGRHATALTALNARMAMTAAMLPRMLAGSLGLGGGLAGGLLGGAFISNSVQQENVVAQLEATIRSTGGAAGFTAGELIKMADGIERVTKFSGDAAISAQSVLLTYTQIGRETFPRALQATIDMAQALGITLTQSAERVGRAIGYPSRATAALAQQGFVFTGQQLKLIKSLEETGRMAEAQAIILGELEESYSGSAHAARDTLGGALSGLRNVMDKLFEVETRNTASFRDEIERLADTLSDPDVIAAFQGFGAIMINALGSPLRWLRGEIEASQNMVDMVRRGMPQGMSAAQFAGMTPEQQARIGAEMRMRAGVGHRMSGRESSSFDRMINPPPIGDGRSSGGGPSAETIRAQEREAEFLRKANEQRETKLRMLEVERESIFLTEEAAMKLAIQEQELARLRERGINETPALVAEIEQWASTYARVAEENRQLQDAVKFMGDTAKGFLSDFRQGLKDGEGAWGSFASAATNALNRISDKLFDMATDKLIGGLLGSLFGGIGGGSFGAAGSMAGGSFVPSFGDAWAGLRMHTGGMVGTDGHPGAMVHAAAFRNAHRFASGGMAGIGPDEVPIVAHRDEEILTRRDPRHRWNGGGSGGGRSVIEVRFGVDDSGNIVPLVRQIAGDEAEIRIDQNNRFEVPRIAQRAKHQSMTETG
jgi:hypothetical protein